MGIVQASAEGYTTRLGGQNRFEVAVNVSTNGWTSSSTVILANYEAFADALAAGPLAYRYNAPILLTHPGVLTAATKNEIVRLNATKIIAVGGPGSISEDVLNELRAMGKTVERISGSNRYEVANNIATHLGRSDKVVLAYGMNFPDALAIAPYAARNGYPILLTNTNELSQSTKDIINQFGVKQTIIVGGEGSVSAKVAGQVPSPFRIGGQNRYEVAENIAGLYFNARNESFIATGMNFADALTGSVLAAKRNQPILLTNSTIPQNTKNAIINNGFEDFTILGGPGSVSDEIFNKLSVSIVGKTIMIDPGHGGTDPGASGNGLVEKEIVLDVANKLNSRLNDSLSKILMTRTEDSFPSLSERVAQANKSGADIFISIHMNAFTTSSANGTETWWNDVYASADSRLLAEEIQKELVKALGTRDRGVKEGDFRVIKETRMPSVLVEMAFISNGTDAGKFKTDAQRQKASDAIYRGIVNYFNKQ
ncbi:N-acetylmuramoyl-L-alanine amidase [Bacillus sp. FJAT-27225]|nr:N-acetylmuramoyl-L-alanine amidase [Bacillus sp. FJAT-27225]